MTNQTTNAAEFIRQLRDPNIRTLVELVRGGCVKVIQNPRTYALEKDGRIAVYETSGYFQTFERKWEGKKELLPEKYKEVGL